MPCSGFDERERLVPDPVIVFELVSPYSIREDRILKQAEHAAVPSIRRYVLLEQSVIGVTVLWRERDEAWRFQTLTAGQDLALPDIGIEIPVDSSYVRVAGQAVAPSADLHAFLPTCRCQIHHE